MSEPDRTATATAGGSVVPARLRIVGWIVLSTALGLLAVVLTIRSTLQTEVEQMANSDIVQEVEEFRTFAERGRDPETGEAIGDPDRLLELYLERQSPGADEVLLGSVGDPGTEGDGLLLTRGQDPLRGLGPAEVQVLLASERVSGRSTSEVGPLRWGTAEVSAGPGGTGGTLVVVELMGPAFAEVDRVTRLVVAVCIGGLVLTAAIAAVVAGQILAPVRAVRLAAARITRLDLGERITVRGRDDVAALAVTVNGMLDRIEHGTRTHEALSRAGNRRLREGLRVCASSRTDPVRHDAALAEMASVLDHLDVLALSASPGFVRRQDVDLRDLTERLLQQTRASVGGRWVVDGCADATAALDPDRVGSAVRALARNALRVSPPQAPLLLGSRVVADHVEVWVRDRGPGLTPDEVDDLMRQVDHRGPALDEGLLDLPGSTGLGLAVVRAVADAHGGSLWVETEPGQGSVFGLRLPLAPDARPAR